MTSKHIYYTVYETTNLVNGKKYRGVHRTTKPNDRYFGSGIAIIDAVKKYGKHNFKKEILFMAFDEDSMYWAESILANKCWASNINTYNIIDGGRKVSGGCRGYKHTEEAKLKISKGNKGKIRPPVSIETRRRISEANKRRTYKSLTKETKLKISKGNKGKRKGIQLSKEQCKKISEGLRGHTVTEETRKKISNSNLGFKHTETTKKNMKRARRKYWNSASGIKRKKEISERYSGEKNPFYNKTHSLDTRKKMKTAWKIRKVKMNLKSLSKRNN